MQINGFTVIAQIINFLVLVWMLKKFLYQPVLDAIDEREKTISSRLKQAEDLKQQAIKQNEELKEKNAAFNQEKTELMNQAVIAVEAQRIKLLKQASDEADAFLRKQDQIREDSQENLNKQISVKTRQGVLDIAKKTLTDLASASLEQQTIDVFLSRLGQLSEEEQTSFKSNFKAGSEPMLVESAFELPLKQQSEIKDVVGKILSAKPVFRFEINPQWITGIVLTANGYQLAWNVSAYLKSMEVSISELVHDEEPITKSEGK